VKQPELLTYYDPIENCQKYMLTVPCWYLAAHRRPRLRLFLQMVRLAWVGCYARATEVRPVERSK